MTDQNFCSLMAAVESAAADFGQFFITLTPDKGFTKSRTRPVNKKMYFRVVANKAYIEQVTDKRIIRNLLWEKK